MFKKLKNIGDCGIVCDFGEEVNQEINTNVIKLFHHVKMEVEPRLQLRQRQRFHRQPGSQACPALPRRQSPISEKRQRPL